MKKVLFSLAQCAAAGIERVRLPQWAQPMDHMKIDILRPEMGVGPWVHLFCPFNKECNGRDPVSVLRLTPASCAGDLEDVAWEIYGGPLPDSAEYRAKAKSFEGVLGDAAGTL